MLTIRHCDDFAEKFFGVSWSIERRVFTQIGWLGAMPSVSWVLMDKNS
jgi:hypothetical protein